MSFSFNNKKVLLILNHGGLGGTERQAFGLAKYLTEEKGCEVKILQLYSNFQTEEYKAEAKKAHIKEVLHFGPSYLIFNKEWSIKNLKRLKWSLQYLWKVRQGMNPYKPEVIVPFLNLPSKLGYYLYKLLPSVKVSFWHQLGADTSKGDWFETFAAYNTPFVIGNAPNCFELFQTKYKIAKSKLNLLPQYLTLEPVKKNAKAIRKMLNIPEKAIVIGMIAQYRPDKYFDLLLEAYYRVLEQLNIETHLVMLGNKKNSSVALSIYNSLNDKVNQYGLEANVSILSNIGVSDVLNILDIGVLVSEMEGMPNTVMEYMSYGIPVVATHHSGCRQLMPKSDLLIPNDVEVLKVTLLNLINSKELRHMEAEKNAKEILKYNLPDYVSKLEQLIIKYI